MLPKIDVIIPAYKAQDTILRTLSSIATQNILDDLVITIVNDADGIGYKKFVDMFSPYMNIKEITMKENGGPGNCRQFGIDNTTNPLITFIDADDTFSGAFALKTLRAKLLEDGNNACCFSQFLEEQKTAYIGHPMDSVWMFGKIFLRSFLNKYKIHFPIESRSNEDGGFNMMCKLCSNDNEKIRYIQDITYYWHYKEDSITRINNGEYSYNASFLGYTDNMIYALKHVEKICPFNGNIMKEKVKILCNLYEYYIETVVRDKRFIEQNFNACKKYYKEIYKDIEDKISDEIFSQIYFGVMKDNYANNKMFGIIPELGIKEFIEKLKE